MKKKLSCLPSSHYHLYILRGGTGPYSRILPSDPSILSMKECNGPSLVTVSSYYDFKIAVAMLWLEDRILQHWQALPGSSYFK